VKDNSKNRYLKIYPDNEKEQMALDLFYYLNKHPVFTKDQFVNDSGIGVEQSFTDNFFQMCLHKRLIQPSGEEGKHTYNKNFKNILGIGFYGENCIFTLMDLSGNVIDKKRIKLGLLSGKKVKNKEIQSIAEEIAEQSGLKGMDFACAGIAIPEEMMDVKSKTIEIFAAHLSELFGTELYVTKSATAAGYADRDATPDTISRNVLYVHSDVGIGVVFKGELIFEADEYSEEKFGAYLRPWNQFSIVDATKDLVSRGVGTTIVEKVHGDMDKITLDIVLEAAEEKDELAEDLVKRSGMALGVRCAYLVNMFNVEYILFGGGTQKDKGRFMQYVLESMKRFVIKEKVKDLKIVPGALGEASSSIGVALLCRRELFMEV
jgi:predicted NBD/HSP70 family sugar kinase